MNKQKQLNKCETKVTYSCYKNFQPKNKLLGVKLMRFYVLTKKKEKEVKQA